LAVVRSPSIETELNALRAVEGQAEATAANDHFLTNPIYLGRIASSPIVAVDLQRPPAGRSVSNGGPIGGYSRTIRQIAGVEAARLVAKAAEDSAIVVIYTNRCSMGNGVAGIANCFAGQGLIFRGSSIAPSCKFRSA